MNNSRLDSRAPEVTVVVVPRERFSFARRSLESIYANTDTPFKLIYVDGGSPLHVQNYLREAAESKGFQYIRLDHCLAPNQARNIGLEHVVTKYLVFVDNDVLVSPGWLGYLVACAEESGAAIVTPLILEGDGDPDPVIHTAANTV